MQVGAAAVARMRRRMHYTYMQELPSNSCLLLDMDTDNSNYVVSKLKDLACNNKLCGWVLQMHTRLTGTAGQISCLAEKWCLCRGKNWEKEVLGSISPDIALWTS